MNINIKCSLKYSLNFKPRFLNISNVSASTNSKIYCKNLIYFILFLEYFLKKNQIKSYSMYVQKKIKRNQPILRAPNKHKKAQVHLMLERYYCILSFQYNLSLTTLSINTIYFLVALLNKSFWFFESSLVNLRVKKFFVSLPIKKICEL